MSRSIPSLVLLGKEILVNIFNDPKKFVLRSSANVEIKKYHESANEECGPEANTILFDLGREPFIFQLFKRKINRARGPKIYLFIRVKVLMLNMLHI